MGEDARLPVLGCMGEMTGSVVGWFGAVLDVALVGRKNGDGMWWYWSVSMFAMVVRVVA